MWANCLCQEMVSEMGIVEPSIRISKIHDTKKTHSAEVLEANCSVINVQLIDMCTYCLALNNIQAKLINAFFSILNKTSGVHASQMELLNGSF